MTARVVVTGAGVISSIGAGVEEFERNLYAGCCGVSGRARCSGTARSPPRCAISIRSRGWGTRDSRARPQRALLCVAAHMALTATGLQQQEGAEGDPNLGLVCGTMFGSVHSITSFDWSGFTDGPTYVNPMEFPNTVINSPAGQAAIKFKAARRQLDDFGGFGFRAVRDPLCRRISALRPGHGPARRRRRGVERGSLRQLRQSRRAVGERAPAAIRRGSRRHGARRRLGAVDAGDGGERRGSGRASAARNQRIRGGARRVQYRGVSRAGRGRDFSDTAGARRGGDCARADRVRDSLRIRKPRRRRDGDARAAQRVRGSARAIPVCAPKAAFGEALGASGALCA